MPLIRKTATIAAAVAAVYLLYFHAMGERGLVGPDEPRYASIAREMAASGDWVTPRLGGEPWFEKPAMLYWLGAVSITFGVEDDRATRFPVALISVVFLFFFHRVARRRFGSPAAEYAVLILGTSVGWAAFSQIGVFDLPLAASLAAALLVLLPWVEKSDPSTRRALPWFGTLLGVSVLAKGLVGPALAALALLPVCRDHGFGSVARDLARPRFWLPFLAIAAPWYALCYAQNGAVFLEEFVQRHHFERFTDGTLQHVQPFWFFVPVLALGFLPWTPLAFGRPSAALRGDPRVRFLVAWVLTTFLLFSISTNKLPGYVLPLFPPLAILAALQLGDRRPRRGALVAAALSLALLPLAEAVLPRALSHGLFSAWPPQEIAWARVAGPVFAAVAIAWAAGAGRRSTAVWLLGIIAVINLSYLQINTFPAIDREAGSRSLWRAIEPYQSETCIGDVRRHVVYGLDYYSAHQLPPCDETPRPYRVTGDPARLLGPAQQSTPNFP